MYSETVMKYFKNPRFVGEIKNPDGHGKKGNMACGDIMEVFIKVKNNKIADIKFRTYGCVAAISSSEALCRLALGKTIEQAEKISEKDIAGHLGKLPPVKFHCSILGAETLREAIKDYRKRQVAKPKIKKLRVKTRKKAIE